MLVALSSGAIACAWRSHEVAGTPEAALRRYQTAQEARDYESVFECIRPDDRDGMLFGTLVGVEMNAGFSGEYPDTKDAADRVKSDLPELLQSYRVNLLTEFSETDRARLQKDSSALWAAMFKRVEDKPALYADLMKLGYRMTRQRLARGDAIRVGDDAVSIAVAGDRATATCVSTTGSEKLIEFQRIEGRWYISPFASGW